MKWVGIGSRYTALVIDLLGCSLDRQLSARGRFSLKTVLMLADQMVSYLFTIKQILLHAIPNQTCPDRQLFDHIIFFCNKKADALGAAS